MADVSAAHGRATSSLVAAIVLALALAGCTDDAGLGSGVGATSPHSTLPPTSASPADIASEKAIAAYVGMWNDMVEAAKTSDWEDPQLGRHATKDALRVITGSLYADYKNGVITKGRPTYDPEVTSVKPRTSPDTVMIKDCADSSNSLKYFKKTGKRVSDTPDGHRLIIAEVKLQGDDEWRVTRFAVQGVGSCD